MRQICVCVCVCVMLSLHQWIDEEHKSVVYIRKQKKRAKHARFGMSLVSLFYAIDNDVLPSIHTHTRLDHTEYGKSFWDKRFFFLYLGVGCNSRMDELHTNIYIHLWNASFSLVIIVHWTCQTQNRWSTSKWMYVKVHLYIYLYLHCTYYIFSTLIVYI